MNKIDENTLDGLLTEVNKPYQYIGHEMFSYNKNFENAEVTFAIGFPDKYEVGASNLGHRVLYEHINSLDGVLCDRFYAPDTDFKEVLKQHGLCLYGLESKVFLKDFDFVGFSIQYELCYPTVLALLDMAGIPANSKDRTDNDPIILSGGPCAYNPEPLKDFVDAFLIGDGEEIFDEIFDIYKKSKGLGRAEILRRISDVEGVYVPSIKLDKEVKKRIYDFRMTSAPTKHPVPFSTSIHDRAVVEIRRGCGRMCRFCQPGHVNLPIRERKAEDIIKVTKELVKNTGYDEFSLLSLSSNDYTNIESVLEELTCHFHSKKVSASLPSQRIDRFNIRLSNLVRDVRKTTVTLAPEAGSQRLRDVINKNLTEEQIVNTTLDCYLNGYDTIKFYFIMGLPTETYADIDEMIELLGKIKQKARELKKEQALRDDLKLNCTLSIFVPKPFTPFQWCGQNSLEDLTEKIHYIKDKSRSLKGVRIKIHDRYISQMEAVLTRGDDSLCRYIYALYKAGCYLDTWDENFSYEKWREIADNEHIPIRALAQKEFDLDDMLPWDFIDTGIKKDWFIKEYKTAMQNATSVPCETKCSNCGICSSFHVKKQLDEPYSPKLEKTPEAEIEAKKYRATITKKGYLKYLSHLDWQNTLMKALFRSGLNIVFTEGFNPIPKISLGVALPLFVESEGEFFEFELRENKTPLEIQDILNSVLDKNAQIIKICEIDKKSKSLDVLTQWARYEFSFKNKGIPNSQNLGYIKNELTSEKEIYLKKKTKKGIDKLICINKSVRDAEILDDKLYITLKTGQNPDIPSVRADELIKFFYPDEKFNIKRLKFFDENMTAL